jgi:hypothetical protein
MIEPRNIDVTYSDRHWLARVEPDVAPFDCPSLMELIKAVRNAYPDEALVFVVDKSAAEGHDDAEAQFLEASEKSGAFVVWSTECS